MAKNWPAIDSGTFRHRIVLCTKAWSKSASGSGEDVYTLVPQKTVWASFEALGAARPGKEIQQSDTAHSYEAFMCKTHYVADVDSTWVVQFENKNYDVTGVNDPKAMHVYTELTLRMIE